MRAKIFRQFPILIKSMILFITNIAIIILNSSYSLLNASNGIEKKNVDEANRIVTGGMSTGDKIALGTLIVAVLGLLIVALPPVRAFIKKKMNEWKSMNRFLKVLRKEMSQLQLLGVPVRDNRVVDLEASFVSLHISGDSRCEDRLCSNKNHNKTGKNQPDKELQEQLLTRERLLNPEQVMKQAFTSCKILLIIGDPGSGKTTLMKYYALSMSDKNSKRKLPFGFNDSVFPIYFPLRELEFDDQDKPVTLSRNLEKWADNHVLTISQQQFEQWLQKKKTLILLDGLDEISSPSRRRAVCRWVKELSSGLENAYFVMTSRATGYRKLDGIELEPSHLRADIMDFSPEQQADFLKKWFTATFLSDLREKGIKDEQSKEQKKKSALQHAQKIIEYLNREDNQAVRELAAVPMLLQIMAILWNDSRYLPRTRTELYDTALNYLLDLRDRHRDIDPLLNADESRRVLAPTALWMHEELHTDEVAKEDLHRYIQPILKTLEGRHKSLEFCNFLKDRAGLIADYGKDSYIFRHKSFREFLASIRLLKEVQNSDRLEKIIPYFLEEWWEETFRFFISQSDDDVFNRFIRLFFQSEISLRLDDNKHNLLLNLVKDAPQKTVTPLAEFLNTENLNQNRRKYVLDCLKTIGGSEAIEVITNASKDKWDKNNRDYAMDIIAEASAPVLKTITRGEPTGGPEAKNTFRNPFEDNVEYILIPGATYSCSVTGKMETVPNLYFCKYPVTNKRYNRFVSYLEGRERELEKVLPLDVFRQKLKVFSGFTRGLKEYLEEEPEKWKEKLRSQIDDKKFKGDDQPVVCVTWYHARSYCFWLLCLEVGLREDYELDDVHAPLEIFRLPTEIEWEWAAGGEPDGSIRKYPWAKEKGGPHPGLANYGGHAGATTPVGRYPEGATPLGLMDMAGNVWEWMNNDFGKDNPYSSLRGGSWNSLDDYLLCSAHCCNSPNFWFNHVGFRVIRTRLW